MAPLDRSEARACGCAAGLAVAELTQGCGAGAAGVVLREVGQLEHREAWHLLEVEGEWCAAVYSCMQEQFHCDEELVEDVQDVEAKAAASVVPMAAVQRATPGTACTSWLGP
jgi:hypothetical protein